MRVSVVIPTAGRLGSLDRCLDAVMNQDFDPSAYEIIVVDNRGSQPTRQLVEYFAAHAETLSLVCGELRPGATQRGETAASPAADALVQQLDDHASIVRTQGIPAVRYLCNTGSRGPAAARNAGWRAATGEVIAFTDDDCIPAPDWLATGTRAIALAQAAAASGRVVVPLNDEPTDYELEASGLARTQFVTANCFYRRETLSTVGGFDERFTGAASEDTDLYFRVLSCGRKVTRAADAVVLHPLRPAPWGSSLRQQRKNMFNALLFKKFPRLYRRRVQALPPWRYYLAVGALLTGTAAAFSGMGLIAVAAAAVWMTVTLRFVLFRLSGTSRRPSHVLEMAVTSALIPPVAIFWRLVGAVRFRTFFI